MNMLFCKVVDLSCSEGIVALAERLLFNTRSGTWILGVIFKGSILKQRTLKNPTSLCRCLAPLSFRLLYAYKQVPCLCHKSSLNINSCQSLTSRSGKNNASLKYIFISVKLQTDRGSKTVC